MKTTNLSILLIALTLLVGCGEVVPPGKTVIILHPDGTSEIVTKGVYKAWGRSKVYFVDGKLQSFTEKMKILCADDINMDVDVKAIMAFTVSKDSIEFIKAKVPAVEATDGDVSGFELSLHKFYSMVVKDVVRGSARNVVSPYKTDAIRPNRKKIEAAIAKLVVARLKELEYPLIASAVLVSNLDYPQTVKDMRNRIKKAQLADQEKAALAEATLAQTQREVGIEQERAKVRIVKATAQADENRILTDSLTPEFLMWRQLEVMEGAAEKLSQGDSNTVFMMPYQTMNPAMLNTAMVQSAVRGLNR